MGVAGVALLGFIYLLFRGIKNLIVFFMWKSEGKEIVGVVDGSPEEEKEYTDSKKKKFYTVYKYKIKAELDGQNVETTYTEIDSKNRGNSLNEGDIIVLRYNPKKDATILEKNEIKEIRDSFLGALLMLVILAACFAVVTFLEM